MLIDTILCSCSIPLIQDKLPLRNIPYFEKDNKKFKSPWEKDNDGVLVLVDESDWKNRLEKLKQKIDFYLKKKEIKNNSTNYLFYDGFKIK